MNAPAWKSLKSDRFWWLLGLCMLLCGKLWFVRYEDIAAVLGPHDDLWFMKRARVGYWFFSSYDSMKFIKEPGYPLFVAAVQQLGVPLRLATELAFLLVAALVGRAVRRRSGSTWLGLVVVAVAAFHPTALLTFQRATADAFHGILMLGLGGAWFWILTARVPSRGGFLLAGLLSAGMLVSRPEGALVHLWSLGLLAAWGLVLAIRCRGGEIPAWRSLWKPAALALALFVTPQVALLGTVRLINLAKIGISSVSEQCEPSYQRAVAALMSVVPEPGPVPYTSVRIETLRRLGPSCPTVARLVPFFSDEYVASWRKAFAAGYEAPVGEIGGGHFHWALRDAVHTVFKPASARETATIFARIADEVEGALDRGEFASRRVWTTSVAADFVPGSERHRAAIGRVADQVLRPWFGPITDSEDPPTVDYFDGMALRRHFSHQALPSRLELLQVDGWCVPEDRADRLAKVRIVAAEEDRLTASVSARPDVIAAVGGRMEDGDVAGFSVGGSVLSRAARVEFESRAGRRLMLSLEELRRASSGKVVSHTDETGHRWDVLLDHAQRTEKERLRPEGEQFLRACVAIQRCYPWLLAAGALSAFAAALWLRAWRSPACVLVVVALAALPLSRLLVFTMIDASLFPGTEPRYLLGSSLLVHVLPWLALAAVLAFRRPAVSGRDEMNIV